MKAMRTADERLLEKYAHHLSYLNMHFILLHGAKPPGIMSLVTILNNLRSTYSIYAGGIELVLKGQLDEAVLRTNLFNEDSRDLTDPATSLAKFYPAEKPGEYVYEFFGIGARSYFDELSSGVDPLSSLKHFKDIAFTDDRFEIPFLASILEPEFNDNTLQLKKVPSSKDFFSRLANYLVAS